MSGGGENRGCWDFSRISRVFVFVSGPRRKEGAVARETSTNTNLFYWWSNEEGNPISRWGTSKLIEANRMMILWWPRPYGLYSILSMLSSWRGEEEGNFFSSLFFFLFFFFWGTFPRTRIRIICLIAPDYRRLNEDPVTMEELTETMECKVAFKWEQL